MSEPRMVREGRKVDTLPNVDFEPAARNPFTGAAVAYRGVPNGQTVRVRRNRTERETLDQMMRMYQQYGDNSRAARAYGRTVNAMLNRGRWGKL